MDVVNHFSDLKLPLMSKIEFKNLHGTYWLRFYSGDEYYKVTFSSCFGSAHVRVEKYDFDLDHYDQIDFIRIPFEYLRDNGYLREVA